MTDHYKPSLNDIIDVAVNHNMPPMIMFVQWDLISQIQLDVLLENGLQPHHTLLDFGCGMGRLAVNAIQYLNNGNYAGIDADTRYLNICKDLIAPIKKEAQIYQNREFDFEYFNMRFDYGMAQSVFTHLSDDQVKACITRLCKVMNKSGQFLFSYIPTNFPIGLVYEGEYPLLHPAHQNADFFGDVANSCGIKFENIETKHPTQKWGKLIF